MSFTEKLVLWLHIAFVMVAIGPVTAATMATPRFIRNRNVAVLRYLYRTTVVYAIVSLGILIAGLILAQLLNDFSKPWLTVSMTLFIVALVLLVLVMRDQHRAITVLQDAADDQIVAEAAAAGGGDPVDPAALPAGASTALGHVERGRIASLGGIVALIWLVILVLMIWR